MSGFDTTPAQIILDTAEWARVNEVHAYAQRRGITISAAIIELVNAQLSGTYLDGLDAGREERSR